MSKAPGTQHRTQNSNHTYGLWLTVSPHQGWDLIWRHWCLNKSLRPRREPPSLLLSSTDTSITAAEGGFFLSMCLPRRAVSGLQTDSALVHFTPGSWWRVGAQLAWQNERFSSFFVQGSLRRHFTLLPTSLLWLQTEVNFMKRGKWKWVAGRNKRQLKNSLNVPLPKTMWYCAFSEGHDLPGPFRQMLMSQTSFMTASSIQYLCSP